MLKIWPWVHCPVCGGILNTTGEENERECLKCNRMYELVRPWNTVVTRTSEAGENNDWDTGTWG